MLLRIVSVAFWAGLFTLSLSGAGVAAMYYSTLEELPDVKELKTVSYEIPMQIFSEDHKLMGEFGEHKRFPVTLDEIPLKMQQAFLAIEDSRFYEHSGIDPIGIARAVLVAVTHASATQGASTITQQVARNFFLTRDRTLERKIKEVFIAWRIEQVLTKEEILELYLNKIALGHRAFGVAAAAQVYYGKELKDLTLAEMATIAGLPKAPSTLNPITSPARARERRHLVLGRMLALGYITEEEYKEADATPSRTYYHETPVEVYAPYVAEEARQFALKLLGESAYTDDVKVVTTVRSDYQDYANYAVFKGVTDYDTRHGYRGARLNVESLEDFDGTPAAIQDLLTREDDYRFIKPALVKEVNDTERTLTVVRRDLTEEILPWESISWAREFKGDSNQGPAPKVPSQFAKAGDLIYTYVDEEGQTILTQLPDVEAALVALNPQTGRIEALVGGYDFAHSKLNRVYQALRQTGSNFKPFLYSAAIARGIPINTVMQDEPIRTWDPGSQTWWEPTNSPNRFEGPMTLREGLAKSKNVVSIRLIRQVGVQNFVTHLQKFGIEVPRAQQTESMALGSVELTPIQTVTGYSTFANGGYLLEPYLIDEIYKGDKLIYKARERHADPSAPDRVINGIPLVYDEKLPVDENSYPQILSHGHAYIMADMLSSVIYGGMGVQGRYWGTGGRAERTTGRKDLHGKTGTTNDVHDAWFTGFNSNLVATAWMGFDNTRNLGYSRVTGPEGGAYSALPIFGEFFKRAQDKDAVPPAPLLRPAGLYKAVNDYGLSDWVLSDTKSASEFSEAFPAQTGDPATGTEPDPEVIDTTEEDVSNIF